MIDAPWFQARHWMASGDRGARMLETESILRQAAAFCPLDKKMGWHLPAHFY